MGRVVLFVGVGVVWCVRSLQSFAEPDYWDPVSVADWFAVLSFSAALFALAVALPLFARVIGGRAVFWVSFVPAAGAAVEGLGNLLEDALRLGAGEVLYVVGGLVFWVGLLAFALVVAVTAVGRRRLMALAVVVSGIGLVLYESGGGVLVLGAWLAAALMALGQQARVAPETTPIGDSRDIDG